MIEIELEKTYLANKLPDGLAGFPHKEIVDLYVPVGSVHPVLRIRKKGDKLEITKKEPIKEGDASAQTEHTIKLTPEEFESFQNIPEKKSIRSGTIIFTRASRPK